MKVKCAKTPVYLICSIFVFLGFMGIGNVYADLKFQSPQQVKFDFNSTISVSVSDNLLIDNLSPGQSADSNIIDVTINTNSTSGYYLSATAGTSSTNTRLVNGSNSSYYFSSLATNASYANVSSIGNNTWGYSYAVGSDNFSNYSGLPLDANNNGSTGAKLVDKKRLMSTGSETVKFKIGAKAATDQVAGSYTNVVNFYAITKDVPEQLTIGDLEYLQDFYKLSSSDKASVFTSMTKGQRYQLKDIRDEKTYYIAALNDDHVWMVQNLDLDLGKTTNGNTVIPTFTSNDTDLNLYGSMGYDSSNGYTCSNSSTNCQDGVISWTPERATVTSASSWSVDDNNPYSYDSNNTNYGNYYNWTAAIASNNSTNYSYSVRTSTKAANSVCPAGWRLPRYLTLNQESGNEYGELFYAQDITTDETSSTYIEEGELTIMESPLSFTKPGFINGSVYSVASDGYYWFSNISYYMHFNNSIAERWGYNEWKKMGFSVRCVLNDKYERQTTFNDLEYMQDFATLSDHDMETVLDSMEEDHEYQLEDSRDGMEYFIAKLKDGNVWMTQNLAFGYGYDSDISSENTDLNLYGSMGYDSSHGYTCTGGSGADCSGGLITWIPENETSSNASMNMDPNNPYSYSGSANSVADGDKDGHGYVGFYYNWPAAIASNDASSYNTAGMVAANSICPKGWRLPNTSTYDFSKLLYAYGITEDAVNTSGYLDGTGFSKANNAPLYLIRSGLNMQYGVYGKGDVGFYHSSRARGSDTASSLTITDSDIYPNDSGGGNRSIGISIRCMLRERN